MSAPVYKILWSTEHNSGELPFTYRSVEEAVEEAQEWASEMVASDDNPEEAVHEYQWEVIRIQPPIPDEGT